VVTGTHKHGPIMPCIKNFV
jgi:hypothetical protein